MKVSDLYAIEGIDHFAHQTLGAELEKELETFREYIHITPNILKHSKIPELIKSHTGLSVALDILDETNMAVRIPMVTKFGVFSPNISSAYQHLMPSSDGDHILKNRDSISGSVNLKTGRVSGDYCKIHNIIYIGNDFLVKNAEYTVAETTACLLHEIGHLFVYYEMLGRLTKTNYVMLEATKRMLTSNNSEQRLVILKNVEDITGTKIANKDKLVNKQLDELNCQVLIFNEFVKNSEQELDINVYNARAFEQLADQFAVRCGYGLPLATGLEKISRGHIATRNPVWHVFLTILVTVIGVITFTIAAQAALLNPIATVIFASKTTYSVMLFFLLLNNPLAVTYDPPKKRIEKLKQQLNDGLKNPNLTRVEKQTYIESHIRLEGIIDKMYHNVTLLEFIAVELNPFMSTQVNQVKAQEMLEKLVNNDLFASAAKLELASLEK